MLVKSLQNQMRFVWKTPEMIFLQQIGIMSLRQRPFIHIECFIKKEVITVYFIHNYLWGYKPINREHFVFLTSMPTSQCKEKNKRRRAKRVIKIRPRMDFFRTKNKPFDFLTLKYHTLGNKYIVSIKKTAIFHAVCAC